jgi:hypothetical protein
VPTLRTMLLALDGVSWQGTTLQTTQTVTASDGTNRVELVAAPRPEARMVTFKPSRFERSS